MSNKNLKIYLAAPRGFCAGVDRAIEIVKKSIDKFGAPVYVRHEIVHNKHVVESLKKIGAIFVEELDEIKDKSRPVIFSAHGVPKFVPEEASNLNMMFVDATCPLVSKVHREAENLNKQGHHILLIGHKNHPEVIGTMGQLPEGSIDLIENIVANNFLIPLVILSVLSNFLIYRGNNNDLRSILFLDSFSIIILNYFFNPILAFTIYFCFLHSIRHSLSLISEINKNLMKGFPIFLRKIIPLTVITAIIYLIVFYFISEKFGIDESIIKIIFVGLASLTFPHILLEFMVEKK